MIKKLLFSIAFFILSLTVSLFGQANDYSDYIVLDTGDTLYGFVDYIDERGSSTKLYKKIRFTDINGKRSKYQSKNVLGFLSDGARFEAFRLYQFSEKITIQNPRYEIDNDEGELYFLRVVSKGIISHYRMEWWEQGESLLMSMDLFKRENDGYFIRVNQGILGLKRKVLVNYFRDCPELSSHIQSKELNKAYELVDFYKRNCVGLE